jgi:hypothetical protein
MQGDEEEKKDSDMADDESEEDWESDSGDDYDSEDDSDMEIDNSKMGKKDKKLNPKSNNVNRSAKMIDQEKRKQFFGDL